MLAIPVVATLTLHSLDLICRWCNMSTRDSCPPWPTDTLLCQLCYVRIDGVARVHMGGVLHVPPLLLLVCQPEQLMIIWRKLSLNLGKPCKCQTPTRLVRQVGTLHHQSIRLENIRFLASLVQHITLCARLSWLAMPHSGLILRGLFLVDRKFLLTIHAVRCF